MPRRTLLMLPGTLAAITLAVAVHAGQEHRHEMSMHMQHDDAAGTVVDKRIMVHFPDELRIRTLANMRDHLLSLNGILDALGSGKFERAGEIAEQRLGMSSLELHGAHEVGQYMPKEMATIGTGMHHAASRFAVAANDAAVSGDVKPALTALSNVTRQCVACHNGFRLQ